MIRRLLATPPIWRTCFDEGQPALWVHGNIHQKANYRIGETRVIANPRSYPGEGTGFDPLLVVEI
ncbi:hypothetical protein [Rhizobium bangladeshense]|uniref:hypothetical protein n=1 Tax=Rhizobium bangladeshense TaxID=1138189 RepID=UPI0007E589B5|nr:hypothetical protein [Rhizobium bangladeshense]